MEMEGWVMLNEEDVNRQAKGIVVNGSLDLEDEEESFFCDFCKFQSGFSFSLKYFRLILLQVSCLLVESYNVLCFHCYRLCRWFY